LDKMSMIDKLFKEHRTIAYFIHHHFKGVPCFKYQNFLRV